MSPWKFRAARFSGNEFYKILKFAAEMICKSHDLPPSFSFYLFLRETRAPILIASFVGAERLAENSLIGQDF